MIGQVCNHHGRLPNDEWLEPTNHPFRKQNDLPNLHDYVPSYSSRVYPKLLKQKNTEIVDLQMQQYLDLLSLKKEKRVPGA